MIHFNSLLNNRNEDLPKFKALMQTCKNQGFFGKGFLYTKEYKLIFISIIDITFYQLKDNKIIDFSILMVFAEYTFNVLPHNGPEKEKF